MKLRINRFINLLLNLKVIVETFINTYYDYLNIKYKVLKVNISFY